MSIYFTYIQDGRVSKLTRGLALAVRRDLSYILYTSKLGIFALLNFHSIKITTCPTVNGKRGSYKEHSPGLLECRVTVKDSRAAVAAYPRLEACSFRILFI